MVEKISVGLLGLGTVGSGVVQIIDQHQDKLMHQVGCEVKVRKILVSDIHKKRDVYLNGTRLTNDPSEVLNDPEIDVVIEVMGGVETTREYILQALRNKKHVVTANKDLMALYGSELLQTAVENQCDLFYEASVAGGIPILRSLVEGLASDRITKMMGIVNGTTNYILTKMSQEGRNYEEVLQEAKDLGYAEADPTSDVEGLDAARKIAILGTLGFSMHIDLDDVSVEGISHVSKEDLEYGDQLGYTMKLIGLANRTDDKVEISVQPTLVTHSHPLAAVHNEFNAVYVYGAAVGETMFYGPGAGKLPTATAVVSDLVEVVKNMRLGVNGNSAVIPQFEKNLKSPEEVLAKYFLRIHAKDQPGTFASLTSLFSEQDVSLEKILQLPLEEGKIAEIIIVTHNATKKNFENILIKLNDLDVVVEVKSSYRVEGDGNR
ncbi:homoserine dehydrogenase [Evansella cellulosilytica]|uniref:Homoserine dehydrogenase n=1 Tax=Evansella cellulosilytica (strain ATCC 21833 / DSM 2522 / FERM P-1141 / JCM 9156 / N-4) TaxID=649639 RepID=E6TY79_EVAC2|nr:homoserine dehydrogenase [Evansella cellulosilytica]ADU32398.1 homoserine dehydrogenase [Evansella cellulosilytica DSM 2522]